MEEVYPAEGAPIYHKRIGPGRLCRHSYPIPIVSARISDKASIIFQNMLSFKAPLWFVSLAAVVSTASAAQTFGLYAYGENVGGLPLYYVDGKQHQILFVL